MELEWLIKNETENTTLDFKREQYLKPKYSDLIKDVISMANTPIGKKKYIVIGIKETSSGCKECFPINEKEFVDKATYQQIIRENIEPYIEIDYYSFNLDGNLLGIIEIDNCDNPPYMLKKNFGDKLKKGDMFIRKGSQQDKITRSDLDEILAFKQKSLFNNKVSMGLSKDMAEKLNTVIEKDYELPSSKAKREIEGILERRKYGLVVEWDIGFDINDALLSSNKKPLSKRTTEELEQMLTDIESYYQEEDMYYISESLSIKLNVFIKNNSEKYIEDANIILKLPKYEGNLMVFEEIPEEPNSIFNKFNSFYNHNYPIVEENETHFIVEWNYGDLPHKKTVQFFDEDIRVFINGNLIGESVLVNCELYGKNLPSPIQTKLELQIK
ncbi:MULTISPECIES: ATP-binding protein [Lysinibacillus]|uniref:ATP-binding protein n=1 Tax=Lysinibacillus TaxID=400634 RepID=UPI0021A8043A|nr:ATP-binding protein [Lysinibacillus capsici]MCT1539728.1 ATP-binding protein [Lysinibacillus capsici]MCT1570798.1 ATP-binding protein [Lysinibacillus capsici]MCT1648201.1 ATP-binding protein [Lysinibacillus capsici]MCT1726743.1 ATP-binding protein [Lysinibacillus capsici]MCT1783872.1 ATP-binding protein [Lysinibacillus capsici]